MFLKGLAACVTFVCVAGIGSSAMAQSPPPRIEAEFKKAGYQPLTAERVRQLLVGNTAYGLALKEMTGTPAGATWMGLLSRCQG